MEDRRLFIAILLSVAVLVVWQVLTPKPQPHRPPQPAPVAREAAPQQETASETGAGAATQAAAQGSAEAPAEAPSEKPATEPVAEAASGTAASGEAVQGSREEKVVLESQLARAVFTNRGAQLVSLQLKNHRSDSGGGVDLVRARDAGPYPFGLTGPSRGPLPLDDVLFEVEKSKDTVTFRYRGAAGEAEKTFRFADNGLLDARISVPGQSDWGVVVGPGLRNPTVKELESRFERRAAVYKAGKDLERLDPRKAYDATVIPGGGLQWVGLEDNYFLTAVLFSGPSVKDVVVEPLLVITGHDEAGDTFRPVPPKDEITKEQKELGRDYRILIEPGRSEVSLASYWGAKQYERLRALPGGLDETIRLGIFRFIAVPLLLGLHWLHENVVQNYGWAIVLMTVLIKLVLLPLTHHSYVSMRKMQQLNPKIQEIRERYRGKRKDKKGRPNLEAQRKMSEEMQALYKAEGVNPAGGCLPMLLQMPVLFAFYYLLSSAVELRNAPWILWIHNLSGPDPYYALPIIMGGTQFLQQRMTPAAGDPTQRRIFQFMPVIMTVLFLGFPSGLVLYWLTNNVLTIAQQWTYNRFLAPRSERKKRDAKK